MITNENNTGFGLYCSRTFADWLIGMNKTLDYPALSYYKLVRLFCRPQYKAFVEEELRKANEFFYHIKRDGDSLKLESSYEVVWLPYDDGVKQVGPGESLTDDSKLQNPSDKRNSARKGIASNPLE